MNELTREQILEMTTEELSLAIAERVFKARIIGNSDDPEARLLVGEFGGVNAVRPLSGERWQTASWRNSDEKAWLDCPKYTEDIAAAWEVLLKLKSMGAEVNVGFYEKWDCSIDYPVGCNYREVAETAQEAICKAALLAVLGL